MIELLSVLVATVAFAILETGLGGGGSDFPMIGIMTTRGERKSSRRQTIARKTVRSRPRRRSIIMMARPSCWRLVYGGTTIDVDVEEIVEESGASQEQHFSSRLCLHFGVGQASPGRLGRLRNYGRIAVGQLPVQAPSFPFPLVQMYFQIQRSRAIQLSLGRLWANVTPSRYFPYCQPRCQAFRLSPPQCLFP